MAVKKNQHFVPKVHLKKFATDKKGQQITIWLPNHDKLISGASIRDQCSRDYFYGKDLRIEEYFNAPEGAFGYILSKLNTTNKANKKTLQEILFLWLLQHVRAERAITEQVLIMSVMRDKITLGQEGNENLMEWLGPPISAPEAIEATLDSAKKYFETISDLRCVLLVNKTKVGFVMSDNPAVSSNKLVLKRYMNYRNWGLGSAGLYVYMPLTPRLGFLAFDRHVYELIGRNAEVCSLKEKDVIALNQMIYLFSNDLVVLPPFGDPHRIIESLKEVDAAKPESTMRVNIAIEDGKQKFDGSTSFSVASDDEFANSGKNGLIHVESVPPIIPQHLPKLLIRQRPRFIDTRSGAGLQRHGCTMPF